MAIECYNKACRKHACNSESARDEGPYCHEAVCGFEPVVPEGYTEDELERDNPHNQWMRGVQL